MTGPIYLVPELCFMTGLSDEQRANFQLMKALGEHTRQDPKTRTKTLMKFHQRMASTPEIKQDLSAWNLELSSKMETIDARTLSPEDILGQGSTKAQYKSDNADWGSCFRKWNCFGSIAVSKWVVLHSQKDEAITKEFIASLTKLTPSLGMKLAKHKMVTLPDNRPSTFIFSLDTVIAMSPQLVVTVVPNNKGAANKKKCYLEKPITSQVVTATVLTKPKGLMATKVGEPWAVKIPMKNTMVIGYDTYHDTLKKGVSVGAVVASMNNSMTKYLSLANLHSNPQQKLNNNMCPAITKALRKYHELNKEFPARIIVYRFVLDLT